MDNGIPRDGIYHWMNPVKHVDEYDNQEYGEATSAWRISITPFIGDTRRIPLHIEWGEL